MYPNIRTRVLLPAAVLSVGAALAAQCGNSWRQAAGDGFPREGEFFASTLWDPDGPGPAAARVVLVGDIRGATHIGAWDPATGDWSPFGLGLNGPVHAVLGLSNGDLVVGGDFTSAGGAPATDIARWDGTNWHAIGGGTGAGPGRVVSALATLPNGDLVAGGQFPRMGNVPVNGIARWDGNVWSALGSGTNGHVLALETLPNGDLIAGGSFSQASGVVADRIARWDGAAWSPLGAGAGVQVWALATLPNGDLVAGGDNFGVGPHTVRWDGTSWSPLGAGVNDRVRSLAVLPGGDLVAGGWFTQAGGVTANRVARWDGASWSAVGSGIDATVNALTALPTGEIVAAGGALTPGGVRVAHWDGAAWRDLGTGIGEGLGTTTAWLWAAEYLPGGDLVIGGSFYHVDGALAPCLARWDGTSWSDFGGGLGGYARWIFDLQVMPNGDLVAGGAFSSPFANIARWDGSSWGPIGSGVSNGSVNVLALLPNGDLIAGGGFTQAGGVSASRIARWDGAAWSALGLGLNGTVEDVLVLPGGDLVVGGTFSAAAGLAGTRGIARWDGTTWSSIGGGAASGLVYSLAMLPNGDLVAAGTLSAIGGVGVQRAARWDGTSWHAMGASLNGIVYGLTEMPNGDLVAGGSFSTPGDGLARWDGTSWHPMLASMGPFGYPERAVVTPDGELLVVGSFASINGRFTSGAAFLTPDCPATVASQPAGCSGAGGLVLQADNLPFVGATFRSTTTGFAAGAIGVHVVGLASPNVLLSALHPSGAPGCELLASLDSQQLLLPVAGEAAATIALPNDPVFAGLQLFEQTLELEFVPVLALRGSNGLTLEIGAL